MPRALTRFLKSFFLRIGVYDLLRAAFPNAHPAILRFHSVSETDGRLYASSGISLSPESFERTVRYLARRYRIADMDQIHRSLDSGAPLPPNTLVVTFDDGYRDNLEAARTLARYGWRATFYITVGCAGNAAPLWLADVRRHLLLTRRASLEVDWRGHRLDHPLRTPDERELAIAAVTRWMKTLTVVERDAFREVLAREAPLDTGERGPAVMLSWDEVRAMAATGMSFGGHTETHCNMVHATEAEARAEVESCRRSLARELGEAPKHFAYPNGGADRYYDERAKILLREAGFVTAVTSRSGWVLPDSDRMALPRIGVTASLAELAHELEWARFRARRVGVLRSGPGGARHV